jgi:hypothetical protein
MSLQAGSLLPVCGSGGVSPPEFCGGTPQLRSKWGSDFLRTNLAACGYDRGCEDILWPQAASL